MNYELKTGTPVNPAQLKVYSTVLGSEKPEQYEQWKLLGRCCECKRKNYCAKECTKHKKVREAALRMVVADKLNEATGGAYYGILEKMAEIRNGRV